MPVSFKRCKMAVSDSIKLFFYIEDKKVSKFIFASANGVWNVGPSMLRKRLEFTLNNVGDTLGMYVYSIFETEQDISTSILSEIFDSYSAVATIESVKYE
jgi:hypothetical protein